MRQFILITLLTFMISCSSEDKKISNEPIIGERIDGPANIRDTINGKILFKLYDNTLIETSTTKNDWLVVGVYVKLSEKERNEFKFPPGVDLVSTKGEVIGKTVDTVHFWMEEDSACMIGAYTHIKNIKKKTIPEKVLSELIIKGEITQNDLSSFINDFQFVKYDLCDLPNLTQYFIEESLVVDMSPRDRITLLFGKEKNLVGIIHSRPIFVGKFKTYDLIRGHKLTVIADLTTEEINKIIKLRIDFYNSVD